MLSTPRRICFGITELDQGGAERALVQIVTRLDRARWSPHVICLAEPGPLVEPLEAAGIEVTCLDATPSKNPFRVWSLVKQFREILKSLQPELLQTFLFHANIVGRFAARTTSVKHVLSGIRVAEKRSKLPLRLDRWTQSRVDRHVCVSQAVADFSMQQGGLDRAKIVVIPNGVDVEQFSLAEPCDLTQFGVQRGSRVLLSVGRIDEQKDPLRLLEAFCEIAKQFADVELLYVGHGPLETQLREQIQRSDCSPRVHTIGWQPDIPGIMKSSNALVLASRWEGMPNVVLEAGAAGLPVVTTNVEGVTEIMKSDEFGVLVGIQDTESLIHGISTVLKDSSIADRAIALQSVISTDFTWNSVVQRYERLFEELLSK
jgi:glycosyltransferase involved in cell wall biosynthesis